MTRVNSVIRWVAVAIAFAVLAGSGAQAQLLQGTIVGDVVDSSQAAVVGAKVVATPMGELGNAFQGVSPQMGYSF